MAFDPTWDSGPVNQPTTQPTTASTPAASSDNAWLQKLAAALAGTAGALGGRALANNSGNPLTQAVPPQLSQLLDNSVARQGYQNPLFQATTQGAYDMLPTFAKSGTSAPSGSLPSVLPPAAPQASGGSAGLGTAAAVSGLGALLAALAKGSGGGGGDIGSLLSKLKSLFAKRSTTSQPYPGGALTGPHAFDPNSFMGWDPGQDYGPQNDFGPATPGDVNTNEWMGQWPETPTPFDPFDPSQLGGDGGGEPDPWGP